MPLTLIRHGKHRREQPNRQEAKNIRNLLCGLVSALLFVVAGIQDVDAARVIGSGLSSPTRTITFSEVRVPTGAVVTTQFASLGVTFGSRSPSEGLYLTAAGHPSHGLQNYFPDTYNPFVIKFSQPVTAAAFDMVTNGHTDTFTALLKGVVVESFTQKTGGWAFYGFTGIAFDEIRVHIGQGQHTNDHMRLDNLQIGAAAPVNSAPASTVDDQRVVNIDFQNGRNTYSGVGALGGGSDTRWNPVGPGGRRNLIYADGSPSTVAITPSGYNAGYANNKQINPLLNDWIYSSSTTQPTIRISGLAPNSLYDIAFYNGFYWQDYTVPGQQVSMAQTKPVAAQGSAGAPPFPQSTYGILQGVRSDGSGTMTIMATGKAGGAYGVDETIAGMQIKKKSGPSTPTSPVPVTPGMPAAAIIPLADELKIVNTYTIQQKHTGRYIDAHLDAGNDFRLVTRPAQNDNTQKWILTPLGNNTYTIQQKQNNRYIDAYLDGGQDFRLVTRPAQGDNTQKWILTPLGNNTYTIRQKHNNRYIDAYLDAGNDFRLVTRPAQGDNTQKWILTLVPPNVNYIFYGTRGKALGQFGQIAPGKWLKIDHEGWNPEKLIEISRNESSVVLSKPLQNKDRVIWELDLQKKILREYYLAAGQPIVPLSRFFPLRVLDMLNTSTSTANLVNQLAQRFAPILNFDRAAEGYPMSAQTFYEKIDPVTGNFKINKLKKYSNTDRASLKNGSIPVYYQVRAVGPKAQVRIRYWWFFGYQEQCNAFGGGKHHGDWEGVMVTLKEDLSGVAAVTYWLHGDHYTRNVASKGICSPAGSGRCGGSRGFDAIVDGRPGVWVGKVGHGSYHDSNSRGPGGCGYWSEWRNPASQADRMDTQLNLVDLDGNSEPWMIGNETATFSWGPDGVGTHPKATNRNEQTGPPTASMRSCIGGATYSESSACYKSECLAGDNEEAGRCTKECLPGYTNMGLYCGKGLKTHAQGEYAYDYPLPTDDWGLVKRGQWWKTE